MSDWHSQQVDFKFQLGELTLFSLSRPMMVRSIGLTDTASSWPEGDQLAAELKPPSQGFYIHALPISDDLSQISDDGPFIRYVKLRYLHCFIDLQSEFAVYERKFSSKTRSTIKRKLRRFADQYGDPILWKCYRSADEIKTFLPIARAISARTYQERLLHVGLPDSDAFGRDALRRADEDRVRAYILFDRDRPISYLYCPVDDGVVTYAHLGYDPTYGAYSPGTILQWLAIKSLFDEVRYRYFDFTEGESEHKRLFATHERKCANVVFLKRTVANALIVRGVVLMDSLSHYLGNLLERVGLKATVRRLLRAGA